MSAQTLICTMASTRSRTAGMTVQTSSSLWLPCVYGVRSRGSRPAARNMFQTRMASVSTKAMPVTARMTKKSASTLAAYEEMLLGSHQPHSGATTKSRAAAAMIAPNKRLHHLCTKSLLNERARWFRAPRGAGGQ